MTPGEAIVFISWAPFCSRSDSIAYRLGGESYMVYSPKWGSRAATILFKYVSQTWRTLRLLLRRHPKVVFAMTPPVIACVPVWLYATLTRRAYVIDAHSGAFVDERWKPLLFLHRFFSRRALTTIVTNQHLAGIVQSWGGHATIVTDVPIKFAEPLPFQRDDRCSMTFVSTFTRDEPVEVFLQAAARLSDIQFFVTGRFQDADPRLLRAKPNNVTFTGFLSDAHYVGLLTGSDAVICLTTADHTMQRGAYEAIYLGRPVITSNFEILRQAFSKGSVFVGNSADEIVDGIRTMRTGLERYQREAQLLRAEKLDRWQHVEYGLRNLLWGSAGQRETDLAGPER
jgi:glycosyltransferase involved in cell wall biosynthesis